MYLENSRRLSFRSPVLPHLLIVLSILTASFPDVPLSRWESEGRVPSFSCFELVCLRLKWERLRRRQVILRGVIVNYGGVEFMSRLDDSGFVDKKLVYVRGCNGDCTSVCQFTSREISCSRFQMIFSNSVLLSRHVCSYNKTNGYFRQNQIQTEECLDTVFCFIFL